MVVEVGAGIVRGVPLPIMAPPHVVYQFNVVPLPPTAVKVIFAKSPSQKEVLSAAAEVGATGSGFTVTVTLEHPEVPHELVHAA